MAIQNNKRNVANNTGKDSLVERLERQPFAKIVLDSLD